MYVLPAAVNLVQRPVPIITEVDANSDGTATIVGTNLDPRVYFDGIPAQVISASSTSVTVTPPPGIAGHVAIVTVFNSDATNSLLLGQAPPTYTYPSAGTPQLTKFSVRLLAPGNTPRVQIPAQKPHFPHGPVPPGFRPPDPTRAAPGGGPPTHSPPH